MKKINYLLAARLDAVKKQAEKWAAHNPVGAYAAALLSKQLNNAALWRLFLFSQ